LNVFEDFKDKKEKGKQLFVISYDQEKAYDSVQAYTIKASLERFNMPEDFIQFVLSGLDQATSCFKTFYGLTEDFKVERLSDRVIRCHLSFTFSLWTRSTRDGKTTPFTAGKRVTVSRTTRHLGFPPQDTRMTQ
jgi:hypothetical protein